MAIIMESQHLKIISVEVPEENVLKSTNMYIVKKNNDLFLIDAGRDNDTCWDYLETAFLENGYHLNDLTAILLTHQHIDHRGLVYRITNHLDVPVYIHPNALPKLKADPEFLRMSHTFFKDLFYKLNCGDLGMQEALLRYDRQMNNPPVSRDWNLHAIQQKSLYGFEVIEIPGHAPDQVGFYLEDENILFCGDLLIKHLAASAFVEPALDGTRLKVLAQHHQSLKKIIDLDPTNVLSGHGSVIKKPTILTKRRLEAIDSKAEHYLSIIANGVSTGREIIQQRNPDKYEKIFFTLVRDALGFLDYLEDEGKIKKEDINGIWHYSVY